MIVAAAVLAAVVLVWLIAFRGGSTGVGFSDDPAAYMPTEFEGESVEPATDIVANLRSSLLGSALASTQEDVATGRVSGEGELPPAVFIAARGSPAQARSGLTGTAQVQDAETLNISGTQATLVRTGAESGGLEVWIGLAAPRDDLVLFAVSFAGGKDTARAALAAMLDAGRT